MRSAAENKNAGARQPAGAAFERELARLAKALAHPARVRILRILANKRECVCGQLVEALPLAQSTVSQHLKVLKKTGFIRGEVEGPRTCYCLEPARLRKLIAFVAEIETNGAGGTAG